MNLRCLMLRPGVEILKSVEPQAIPRLCAPCSPRALNSRGFADATGIQFRQTRPWRMAGDSRQAGIDHSSHTIDGDRTLSDIGRKNNFTLIARLYCAILLGSRQIAVQR